jgi:SSS family solute:Na+ symporter
VYIAATAFLLNVVVTLVLTLVFRALKLDPGVDQTRPDDYAADLGDTGVEAEVDPHAPAHA